MNSEEDLLIERPCGIRPPQMRLGATGTREVQGAALLEELVVENLGVIEHAAISFDPGMTVLSGETGAGKTLVVGAIQMAIGSRIDPRAIRVGAPYASVDARFTLGEKEYVLSRTISNQGRSKAYINGKMATLFELSELGSQLIDIHGQHAQMRLESHLAQLAMLDEYLGVDLSMRKELQLRLDRAKLRREEMTTFLANRDREAGVASFELGEILKVAPESSTEDIDLEVELDSVVRAAEFRSIYSDIASLGDGDDSSGGGVYHRLTQLARRVRREPSLEEIAARLDSVAIEIGDIATEALGRLELLESNPSRIDEIRSRLVELRDLKKRFGPTLGDVIRLAGELRQRLELLAQEPTSPEELSREVASLSEQLNQENARIRELRTQGAAKVCAAVNAKLEDLSFSRANFDIAFSPGGDGSPITFFFTPNPGQASVEIAKFASGGELSRIMLALSLVMGSKAHCQLFDEVDTGIGGKSGNDIASALHELSASRQVIVVTHLAQVAAVAENHFTVRKITKDSNTLTEVQLCANEDRIEEIARMLSGTPESASARRHAIELLGIHAS